jgi:hypothetical protein
MQLQAPDDGRGGARNMLSDTKRQVINLENCCIWLVNFSELYDDARNCQRQRLFFLYMSLRTTKFRDDVRTASSGRQNIVVPKD